MTNDVSTTPAPRRRPRPSSELAFTDRLIYVRNEGFRTPDLALPFKVWADLKSSKCELARPGGQSANSFQAECLLSTLAKWNEFLKARTASPSRQRSVPRTLIVRTAHPRLPFGTGVVLERWTPPSSKMWPARRPPGLRCQDGCVGVCDCRTLQCSRRHRTGLRVALHRFSFADSRLIGNNCVS
jgi:hypothetical protein